MYIIVEIARRLIENMGSVCYQKYTGQATGFPFKYLIQL